MARRSGDARRGSREGQRHGISAASGSPGGEIQTHYVDALGQRREPSREAISAIRRAMAEGAIAKGRRTRAEGVGTIVVREGHTATIGAAEIRLEDGRTLRTDDRLPPDLPAGYHEIKPRGAPAARLIVAPGRCYLPPGFRAWGWAIQLYAARSRASWGIGDLGDLRRLARWSARDGGRIAMVNPLSAAEPTLPQQPSPYFPSTRRFRSPLYLRIEEIDGARSIGDLDVLASLGRDLNRDRRIDRDAVFRLKMAALDRIWRLRRDREDRGFEAFRQGQGESLRQFATYCALAERFAGSRAPGEPRVGWRSWPRAFQHPQSPFVRRALRERPFAERVRFHEWLQYELDAQLARASAVVPVMQDLPIGFDPDGADAWAFQDVLAPGMRVGAPPDEFNTKGQNWGLPPFVPRRLRAAGYEPFIQTIRGCLRHAGGLRIDHVMGLFRLFWIPAGMEAADGAYVRSAADDLLGIVALESQRAGAVIVGEDLGTVDERDRQRLLERGVLSYRLVWFEKVPPARFPEQALAAVTTHDLPTVAGLWSGADLDAQKRAGGAPNEEGTQAIRGRITRMTKTTSSAPAPLVIARLHEALARAPSRIVTATLEDAMAVEERPNIPATTGWPNWCIALPRPIETLERDPLARRIARALSKVRVQADGFGAGR